MRKNVLFVFNGVVSHFNSIIGIAQMLIDGKVNVTFASDINIKELTRENEIQYFELQSLPFGCGLEQLLIVFEHSPDTYLDTLINRLSFRIYQDRKKKLEALIEELKPDVIFLDSFLCNDFIILYPHLEAKGIKLVFLQTTLSTLYSEGTPPLNADLLPENQKAVKKVWKRLLWQRKVQRFKDKIKYLGKDDLSMVRQKFEENKIPQKYKIVTNTSFRISFANIPEWILAPAELEFFPERKAPWQTYLGSMIDLNRKEFGDEKYADFEEQIKDFKNSGKKLIYCSFGTLTHLNAEGTILFFKNLLQAAGEKEDCLLICSGSEDIQKHMPALPNNVFWFKFVPQLRLLPQVDIFVTHGGLNSIKESLHFCVPMLIYPMYSRTDNNGNAARIFHHRLGLRGEIEKDSPQEIAEKIHELLSNPIYKQNLQAFKEKTEAKYTEESVIALLEEVINSPIIRLC